MADDKQKQAFNRIYNELQELNIQLQHTDHNGAETMAAFHAIEDGWIKIESDLAAAQAIIVDAGQQVADLKAKNERLREALESVRSILIVHPEWNAPYDKQVDWLLEQEEKATTLIYEALQPKEDKQS